MHFKRTENIFKLKKIAWAENDCLSWMLLCNPLGDGIISRGAIETEPDVFCAKKRMQGEEGKQGILLAEFC